MDGITPAAEATASATRSEKFPHNEQIDLRNLLPVRKGDPQEEDPLPLEQDRYVGAKGVMVWIDTAVKKYGLRPRIGAKPKMVAGEQIVRETRPVLCVKSIRGIDHTMSKMRRFILERQCPLLQEAEEQVEEAKKAEAKARQEGFMSALQFGIAVGLDKFKVRKGQRKRSNVRIRIAAKAMVLHGTGLLPNNRKPKHRWLQPKTIGGDDRLFIHRSFVRPIKRELQRREKAGRYLAYPDRVSRPNPDHPERKAWFTRASVVAQRLGYYTEEMRSWRSWAPGKNRYHTETLRSWAMGKSRIPGGVKNFRFVLVGRYFYYLDEDWQAVPAKPKGKKRTATYRLEVPIRRTKTGFKFPTWKVAELCGVSATKVGNWVAKRLRTPGCLALDPEPGKVGGRKVREFDGAQVIPIVRELGRPVAREYEEVYPAGADTQSTAPGSVPKIGAKCPALTDTERRTLDYIKKHPRKSARVIGDDVGVSEEHVRRMVSRKLRHHGVRNPNQRGYRVVD